jgi:hypothetical protein
LSDDARQLESSPAAGEGEPGFELPTPLHDYCAACGVRAPEVAAADPAGRQQGLRALGWIVLPPRALHQEVWPRPARNAMCAACLVAPSGFVRALLEAWGVLKPEPLRS